MKKESFEIFDDRKKSRKNSAGNEVGGPGGKGQHRRYGVPEEEIIRVLKAKQGLISLAAKSLRITHECLNTRVRQSKKLQETLALINEANLDLSESTLYTMIKQKNLGAICFHLKCKGKHRGWVERQEVTGAEGKPLNVKITVVYDKDGNGAEDKSSSSPAT